MPQVLSTELTFELNPEFSFNIIPFDTNLKYRGENGSLYPLKGETERKGEKKSPAFPLYVSQQCSTEFSPKVWTHKTAPVPLWKLWHHDWDWSVTSTSIWPVSTDSGPLPYQYRGVRINSANQTAWVTFCEFHSSLDWTTDIWRMFSLYNYRSYIYQPGYWSREWLRASLDWLWWKERLHNSSFLGALSNKLCPVFRMNTLAELGWLIGRAGKERAHQWTCSLNKINRVY